MISVIDIWISILIIPDIKEIWYFAILEYVTLHLTTMTMTIDHDHCCDRGAVVPCDKASILTVHCALQRNLQCNALLLQWYTNQCASRVLIYLCTSNLLSRVYVECWQEVLLWCAFDLVRVYLSTNKWIAMQYNAIRTFVRISVHKLYVPYGGIQVACLETVLCRMQPASRGVLL